MDQRIILFRGMNTGGVRAPVAEQRDMAREMGLGNPRTLLASGNLVVETDREARELETAIEAEMAKRFGRRIEAVVRSPRQWAEMIASNPFAREARSAPDRLLVMVMKDAVRRGAVEALQSWAAPGEQAAAGEAALFLWLPDGMGRSRMADRARPQVTGPGTGRNWNTVVKLAEMVGLPRD